VKKENDERKAKGQKRKYAETEAKHHAKVPPTLPSQSDSPTNCQWTSPYFAGSWWEIQKKNGYYFFLNDD